MGLFVESAALQPLLCLFFFFFFGYVTWTVTSVLKYAAALLLILAARPVFVFALRHFLLADLAHEIEEHLRGDRRRRRR